MRCCSASVLLLLLIIISTASASSIAPAGAPTISWSIPAEPCLEKVLPCTAYLKSPGRPSQTCCTALNRAAAATEMPCLCRLLADPAMLDTFNVTREQMFGLPTRCGLPVGCRAAGSEPVVETTPPSSAVSTPRAVPSSGGERCVSSGGAFVIAIATVLLVKIAAVF